MNDTQQISVLVVDDHVVVREGLCALIRERPDLEVIGEAADGNQAVKMARELEPDIILLDLVMPVKDGIEAIREIIHDDPQARILVLTSFSEERRVYDAIKAGALGYLLKETSYSELVKAIYDVYRGEISIQPSIALKVIRELNRPSQQPQTDQPLTDRELDVLKCLAEGYKNQEIADKLQISYGTVTKHVSNILGKLHQANRTQVALYAIRQGMID
ncbi:MAG: response regulator transcription factor [Anaerolineales bacterium]|nr:response regulator transcription factor [Anaerolineales bacterium]